MILTAENILLFGSILLFISIIASKTSYKIGIPTLILFLLVGMLAGSEGPGGAYFEDYHVARFLGVVALNFILFSGGLDTKFESVKPILWRGISLSTIGVLITAISVGYFVHWLTDLSLIEGFLMGAIVSSTDAAAIFSILRSKSVGLKRHIRPTLELESGSNDPMAYFLMISLITLITAPDTSPFLLIPLFFKAMAIGSLSGYLSGRLMVRIMNRIKLDVDGLYPVLLLAFIFFTFSFTDVIGGNGFLAVYIAALVLGNNSFIHKKSLIKFYDGQAWLMQIIMFLTLGLLVYPSKIAPIAGTGMIISLFLIFIARPVAVFIALSFFKMRINDKLLISWIGLRGAVPIVFATYPMIMEIPNAAKIFHLVFFISVTSVLLQGTSLSVVAKWLNLTVPEQTKKKYPLELELSDNFKSELVELEIDENSRIVNQPVVRLRLPKSALIVLINRGGKYITPNGATIIAPGDKLLVMADNKSIIEEVYRALNIPAVS